MNHKESQIKELQAIRKELRSLNQLIARLILVIAKNETSPAVRVQALENTGKYLDFTYSDLDT